MTKLFVLFVLVGASIACARSGEEGGSGQRREIGSVAKQQGTMRSASPVGVWVLASFHDSITEHHRIGKYRWPIPAWSAVLLEVDADSAHWVGTLARGTSVRNRGDTLLAVDKYGEIRFLCDRDADTMVAEWKNVGYEGSVQQERYRRVHAEERHLMDLKVGDVPRRVQVFQENYHAYLTQLLFAGLYEPLTRGAHAFRIDAQGGVKGHPAWKEFWFHDYFGTLHPFADDVDGLVFSDPAKDWPEGIHSFNWRFSGDTLVLRSMTTDGDRYYMAKGELRYLKRS